MLLTERAIRQLIYNVLLEGQFTDDIINLKNLLGDERQAARIDILPKKWKDWLIKHFLLSGGPSVGDIARALLHALELVEDYSVNEPRITSSYKVNSENKITGGKFKTFIDTLAPLQGEMKDESRNIVKDSSGNPLKRQWLSPGDTSNMGPADLEYILDLFSIWDSRPWNKRAKVDKKDESWERDLIGTFGPWKLYFPTNQQNSINIAGSDPVTNEPYTTWCTARATGQNLFYDYTSQGIMLFYAINTRTSPNDPESRISLGFKTGELVLDGQGGGYTVDASNKGLTIFDLKRILGKEYTDIVASAQKIVDKYGGAHPVEAELNDATKSLDKFNEMLRGVKSNEEEDFIKKILNRAPSPDIAAIAATHKSKSVREAAADCRTTPPDSLRELAKEKSTIILYNIAKNPNTPKDILLDLINSERRFLQKVAMNTGVDEVFLANVAERAEKTGDFYALEGLAKNPAAGYETLKRLARNSDAYVRSAVIKNPKTHIDILAMLLYDPDSSNRSAAEAAHAAQLKHELDKREIAETRRLAHRILREIKRREYSAN
jgi:hypothetical protein